MRYLLLMALATLLVCGGCSNGSSDSDGGTTDSDTDSDTDTGDLPSMEPCEGGYYDPATDLCWQDPPSTYVMTWYEATGTPHVEPYPTPRSSSVRR